MPIKLTWKSIVGLVSLLAGAITSGAITPATVGGGTPGRILAAIGGVLLAFERIADAIDYKTDSQFNTPLGVSPAEKAIADKANTIAQTVAKAGQQIDSSLVGVPGHGNLPTPLPAATPAPAAEPPAAV